MAADPAGTAATEVLVGFGRRLRAAGLPVGTGALLAFARAAVALDPTDLEDLYWAGRCCLVDRMGHLATYDRVFAEYFLAATPARSAARARSPRPGDAAQPPAGPAGRPGRPAERPADRQASDLEVLRHKDFAACSPAELAAIRRLLDRMALVPPRRPSRRTEPAHRGRRPDLRRLVRAALAEPDRLPHRPWRRRRTRPRPRVLLLDVSGSMAAYSRVLLQFAYSARRGPGPVEVFCFASRLTRLTRVLGQRDPDAALAGAAAAVTDWDGGTRIGESLAGYLREHARRGGCRGAVVVICSDGLERGDPEVLSRAMARLSRLSHRVVWVNPLAGDPRFRPQTRGMRAALPHVDALVAGASLAGLEELARVVAAAG